jgi:Nif-specific regulatory protein
LDEVVELSSTHQSSLLRALQERRFYRVGGREEVKVNVRIVAATHNNLREAVAAKRFREDLYFRLAVFEVELPPLRDRGEDIVILARRFVREQAMRHGKERLQLALETEQALLAWHWPGNVRELQNAIERAIVDTQGELIHPENLPAQMQLATPAISKPPPPPSSDAPRSLSDIERDTIADSLKRHNGNIVAACKELGIPRSTMYRRIVLYGLK